MIIYIYNICNIYIYIYIMLVAHNLFSQEKWNTKKGRKKKVGEREVASKETWLSLYLGNRKVFYTIILAIKFYYGGKKIHFSVEFLLPWKNNSEKNSDEKKTQTKLTLVLENVLFC